MGYNMTMDSDLVRACGFEPRLKCNPKIAQSKSHEDIRKFIRVIDEQNAVTRYVWHNLPCDLSSAELERLLYYKGELCFFYEPELKKFFFMPYALDGTIDYYGRYRSIHPVPIAVGTSSAEKEAYNQMATYLATRRLEVLYDIPTEPMSLEDFKDKCILIWDYTKQFSENIIPRQQLQEPLINEMSKYIPYMSTCLKLGTGIKGMRIQDADQRGDVDDANRSLERAALSGDGLVPILSKLELNEIQTGGVTKPQDYMLSLQSMDNLRLSGLGLENGGLFEKKAHLLESENAINNSNISLIYQDGLNQRDRFCNILNSIIPFGVYVTPSENQTAIDEDMNGKIYDTPDTADTTQRIIMSTEGESNE